jgi:hypothetical protein
MAEPRFCVVCGLGSHRLDWASKQYPSCDGHSAAEVKAAIAKLSPPAPAPAQPPMPMPTAESPKVV